MQRCDSITLYLSAEALRASGVSMSTLAKGVGSVVTTPLWFIPVGYGYGVCANQVLAVLIPDTAPSKRLLDEARTTKRYVDMTCGNGVKCLLLTVSGQVIGCAVKSRTMLSRLNAQTDGEEEVD